MPYPPAASIAEDCLRIARRLNPCRRYGARIALAIVLCLGGSARVDGQSIVGGRNVNIAGGKQVLTISPYEVKGDVLNRAQNEPSCAISTRNPKNVLCGANDYRMVDVPGVTTTQIIRDAWLGEFQSADGGDTWESTLHRGFFLDPTPHPLKVLQMRAAADPTVRSGPAGLAFYSGIAFTRDRSRSVVFVTTYADVSTREDDKVPFKFVRTSIPDIGTTGRFIDKPWMFVEAAPVGQTCTVNAQVERDGVITLVQQTVPASIVHLVYSVFVDSTDTLAQLMYVRSDNCGATFTRPKQLNQGTEPANGAAIAKPLNSTSRRVFTAWRRVQTPTSPSPNAIVGAISDDNGTSWSAPILIANICPFDQGTTTVSFRTTAFPAMTADATGRAYVTWADRGRLENGQCNPEGAARVQIATSTDGVTWTRSAPVPSATPEHQILPAIVFTAGRLALAWLDFTEDASRVFGRFVSEAQVQPVPGIRHTADVRASMAQPGAAPVFDQPTLISEYLRGVGFASGRRVATQLQWNAVNRRWARRGTVPFNGDYIDIATLPYLPPNPGSSAWVPNNQAVVQTALGPAPRVPLLLLAWTDNRDMRTGPDIDIPEGHDPDNPLSPQPQPVPFVTPSGLNLGPSSIADPTLVRFECTAAGDVYKTGTMNQNAYAARATIGVAAGSPANNKVLGNLQRSFVVFVRNDTLAGKTFKLVASQPAGGFAAFDQFVTARTTTDIFVPARSSVSRTVFVTRNPGSPVPLDPDAAIRVDVIETQGIVPVQVTTIYINSDPSAPEIDSPEIDSREIFSPEIDSPEIDSPEIDSPEIDSRGFSSPEIDSPEIDSPEIDSPEIDSPEIDSQEIRSLGLQTPEIDSPEIDSPEIDSPEIDSPEIDSPEIDSSAITDITFNVTNDGNTTGQYNARALVSTAAGLGFRYQVIVRRTYSLPAVGGDCRPTTIAVSKVAVNLQDVTPPSPEIDSPEIDSPEIDSSALDTASFFVAPDETVEVVVRVRSRAVPTTAQLRSVIENVDLAVQQEAVNSDDVAVGITEPPVITTFLSVATQALAAAQTTAGYNYTLQATGGPEPHVWSVTGGALPPGIVLSANGQLTGSPTADGTFTFTVLVVDADGSTASRAFALSVTTPGTASLAFVTQPSNPILGAVITPYPSVRALTAAGTPAAGVPVTVQLIGAGTLVGTLTRLTGPAGVAVFDDLRLTSPAAGAVLLATSPTFTDTRSVAFGTTQPDLIIESLTHSPINPTSADSVTITAVVRNIGNGPSGPSTISLLLSGEAAGDEGTEFPVPPLAAGATYTVQRLAPPVSAGPTTASATIDGSNTVPESAEGNNTGADAFVATPQTAPVVEGLASWWRGEGDANDSADGSHGTLIGGVEFGAGRTGGLAFELDGVNDRIDVGAGFNFDDLTLSAWVFIDPATNQGDRVVISKDNIGAAGVRKAFVLKSSNTFSTAPNNRPAFIVIIGNPPDPTSPLVDLLEGPGPLAAGWHHLAGVRDTSAGRFELYIDGVLAASKVPTVVGVIDSVVNTIIGGVSPTFFGQFFAGRIDDPQIFNQALTAVQISALATASSEAVLHSPVSSPETATEPLLVRDAQGVGSDANRDLFVLHGNGQISMMSGNGTGTFTLGPAITIPGLIGTVRDLRVGRIDNFGNPHVTVVTDGATDNFATVQTNGNLGWGTPSLGSMPAGLAALVRAQFNTSQDAFTDLAFVSPSTNQLFIQLNTGLRTTIALPGQEPIAIKAGHINKAVDGFLDLVVLNRGSRDVTVLLGNGAGGFAVSGTFPLGAAGQRTPSNSPDALELADFNTDGDLDVAVASDAPIAQEGQSVVVLLGSGNGSLGAGVAHNVGAGPLTVTVEDLDNDGNLDIATANPGDNSIAVLHGDGAGNFGPAGALTAGNTPRGIIAVDVTNDGKPEIVVANQFQRESVDVDEVSTITGAAAGPGPFAVTTTNDAGPGSLRQAITNANARAGHDTITFNIPGGGTHVIALTSNLPAVTDPLFIDGTTQPGYIAAPLVELNGAGIAGNAFGIEISIGGSTVRGLAITNFAPGDSGHGLLVNAGAGGTVVQANYIGLSAAGTPLADATVAFGLVAMAPTIVGGNGPRARNAIAGAATTELTLGGGGSWVVGNFIGTTGDGLAVALANSAGTGIDITQGASYTIDSNVVSGLTTGVFVNQPVTGLTFIRNLVGTNAAGDAPLPGPPGGIGVSVLAPNTTIGGDTAATGNTITGYTTGIVVASPGNALIRNNRIGTSSDGSLLLPGVTFGVVIGSANNTVTGNTIASTVTWGVGLLGSPATGNSITDNVIRDNANIGVSVVPVAGESGNGNTLVPNTFTNNGLSIDLNSDGPTANDPGDADTGANDLQNIPGLTGATPNGATTLVTGVLHSTPNSAFTIHIFQNAFCPAIGRGEGTVIGTVAMSTGPDGRGAFSTAVAAVANGTFLSATATNLSGSTSEFSDCVNVAAPSDDGTTLAFVAQPSNSAVNAVISPAVAVAAYDDGDPVAGIPVTLQLQGGAGLSGTLVRVTNANGVATFDDLSLGLAVSNVTLLATAEGFASATSTTFGTLLPDLVVQSLTYTPANPTTGSPITFDAVVRNAGTAPAAASTARWSVTPGPNAQLTPIPALAPGATFAIQRQVTLNVAQDYVSNLAVDFTNQVLESNEENNTASRNLTVTNEGGGGAMFVVINTNDAGGGSLRQAILDANDTAGVDSIHFNIPDAGPFTIAPLSPLPTLTGPVNINATTQPGYAGSPIVGLNGSAAGVGAHGLHLTGGQSTIRGLQIAGFSGHGIFIENGAANTVAGNYIGVNFAGSAPIDGGGDAVQILESANNTVGGTTGTTAGGPCTGDCNVLVARQANAAALTIRSNGPSGTVLAAGNQVYGNHIGVNAAGTQGLAGANAFGIVAVGARGVTIGSGTPQGRNVISGNNTGIVLQSDLPVVSGNYIGTNAAGTAAIVNSFGGTNNVNGGVSLVSSQADIRNNVLSGNGAGVVLAGLGQGNVIRGNIIGLNATGTAPVANDFGILFTNQAQNSTVGGTTPADRNIISGNNQHGVRVGLSTQGNRVIGNYIGTNAAGVAALGNQGDGILVENATDTRIGGTQPGEGNVISANANGVSVMSTAGNTASGTVVLGNVIGLDATGTVALGNTGSGVRMANAGAVVGGTTPAARNVISANNFGVLLSNSGGTHQTTILGNYIGTDITGTLDRGNGDGVNIGSAPGTVVGGIAPGAGNVISGNSTGVFIFAIGHPVIDDVFNAAVQGNLIGLNAAGTAALGNATGVLVASVTEGAAGNLIGGAAATARNVISGNSQAGVQISGITATGNVVRNNFIGTDITGTANVGNGVGVRIVGAHGNEIAGAPDVNLIKGNLSHGVTVEGASAIGNQIANNQIFDNGGLGIDLGGDGVTANDATDADTGPNGLQNFPVLTAVSTTSVTVTLQSTPNANFAVQLFSNAACDPSGNGEGQTRFDTLGLATDGTGFGSVVRGNLSLAVGTFVTAAVTGPTGTSEFSACAQVTAEEGTTVTVVATDASANEAGPDPGSFTFTRTGPTASPLNVTFTLGGTATTDVDYLNTIGTLVTIPATQSSITVNFTPLLDALVEDNETVVVTITPGDYTIGDPSTATAIITENTPTVTVTAQDASAVEGADPGVFRFARTGPTVAPLTIPFTLGGTATPDADYVNSIGGQVTIPLGQPFLDVQFTPTADGQVEGPETVTVTLLAGTYVIGNPNTATVTITDGAASLTGHWEGLPPATGLLPQTAGPCNGYNVALNLTQTSGSLSGTAWATAVGGTCTDIVSIEQSNGQRLASTLTGTISGTDVNLTILGRRFSGGVPNAVMALLATGTVSGNTMTLTASLAPIRTWTDFNGNLVPECNLALAAPNGECGGAEGAFQPFTMSVALASASADVALNITDAPDPAVVGENVAYTFAVTNRGPAPADFVSLTGGFSGNLSFVSATGGCSFGTPCALGTIVPGATTNIVVTMTATAAGTATASGTATQAVPSDPQFGNNSDNETTTVSAPVVTLTATDPNASEVGPDPGTFTFSRTGPTTSALQVNYTLSSLSGGISGTDFIDPALLQNGSVTIPIGQASATFTLTPVLDALIEGSEDITLTLLGSPFYTIGSPSSGTVIIADAPVITIQATDASASEAGGDTGTFTITSTSLAAATVNFTVTGTASSGTDYASLGVSVLKPAGVLTVTLTVAPVQDGVPEGAEDVTVTLAAGAYAIGAANAGTVTIADSSALSVVNTNDAGPGSLRAAMDAANANPDVSAISFNIPGAGPHVINVPSLLPSLTQPVVMDGTTQAGYSGVPLIHLLATAGGGGRGIQINGNNSTVRGLSITGFSGSGIAILSAGGGNVIEANYLGITPAGLAGANVNGLSIVDSPNNRVGGTTAGAGNVISGNAPNLGLRITGAPSNGNLVVGNFIGLNPSGTTALPNSDGVWIDTGASNTTIGGTTAAARNVVSGNVNNGILVSATSTTTIVGNFIGTHVSGATAVANTGSGIVVQAGAANTTIGGAAAGTGNIISGNGQRGILVAGPTTTGTVIAGNRIGTNVTGTAALGNGFSGVELEGGATTVGGTAPGARNLISGNAVDGIAIESNGNLVQGNFIGTNAGGSGAIPNLFQGVFMDDGAANNVVGGTDPAARNVISGNGVDGVQIGRPGNAATNSNQVLGNYIGTDPGGTAAVPNGFNGVTVHDGTANTIGGTAAGARNVISGNTQTGVWLDPVAQSATANFVQGNYIGVNAAGTAALPNTLNGVHTGGANIIGGAVAGAGNVISGNGNYGVLIVSTSSGTQVWGNYIGLNAAGSAAIPNTRAGVASGTSGAAIGGTPAGAGNVISGNGLPANPAFGNGIEFTAGGSNTVQGNLIGTNASGTAAIPNLGRGINISNSNNNQIGGTTAAARNVISGNGAASSNAGVQVGGTSSGNQIFGNYIGTDFTGTSGIPNFRGVVFSSSNSTLGGPAAGEGNLVAFNTNAGVLVVDNSVNGAAVNNRIRGNSVFSNGTLGIDLGLGAGENGVTANDAGDADLGPNNRQNFPVVTQATAGVTTIQGTLNSLANTFFFLDFYASTSCDASGNGEGQRYLGTFTVNTDGSGNGAFSSNVASAPQPGEFVTATATDQNNSTSEFSACFQLTPTSVQVFTIQNGSETGPTPGNFMVFRSVAGPLPLDVNLSLVGGTATAGEDFTPAAPTVIATIPAFSNSVIVPITIIDDPDIEGPETVQATVAAGAGYVPAGVPATLVITDNDGVGQIAGTLTTAGDEPLPFSIVYVYNDAGVPVDGVVTELNGTYLTNPLPVGTYFVRTYNFQGFIDELYDNIVCSPDCAVTGGTPIPVAAGQTAGGIDFLLDLGGTIGGTVTSTSNGLGVPFATVELRREGVNDPNLFIYTQADDLGVYEVTGLVPGNYFARTLTGLVDEVWNNITCMGCNPTSGTPIPVAIGSVTNNIDFSLADGARITGTVRDATTTSLLADAPVQIFTLAGQLVATALTDVSGSYSSTGLTPGTYFARTKNDFIGPLGVTSGVFGYADELFSEIDCATGCAVTSGTPITVGAAGTEAGGINFTLTPPAGQTSVTTTDATAIEGGLDVATFTVTVSGPSNIERFAGVFTAGSATHQVDYTMSSPDLFFQAAGYFVVRIPAGQASSTVTLSASADGVVEGDETVELQTGFTTANATISDD